jgi:hypothetical protein
VTISICKSNPQFTSFAQPQPLLLNECRAYLIWVLCKPDLSGGRAACLFQPLGELLEFAVKVRLLALGLHPGLAFGLQFLLPLFDAAWGRFRELVWTGLRFFVEVKNVEGQNVKQQNVEQQNVEQQNVETTKCRTTKCQMSKFKL